MAVKTLFYFCYTT